MQSIAIVATVASHLRNFHLPWVRHLRSLGVRVIGVANDIFGSSECCTAFCDTYQIPFSRSPVSLRQAMCSGRELRCLVDREQVGLVHLHTPNAAFWGRLALGSRVLKGNCQVVHTAHGFHFHCRGKSVANAIFYQAEQYAARFTNALLAINQDDFQAARKFRLAPGGFCDLIPGVGIDTSRFNPALHPYAPSNQALKAILKIPGDAKLILMVAEFSPGKRHHDALSALAALRGTHAHLLLAGLGEPPQILKRQVSDCGLEGRVHFLGFRQDIPNLLAAADVVLLTSGREGLPASVLEAMSMGKVIVGADARGTRDLLEPGFGWTYPVGHVQSLTDVLYRMLKGDAEAYRRALLGPQRVKENFAWPVVERKLKEVYFRLGVPVDHSALPVKRGS